MQINNNESKSTIERRYKDPIYSILALWKKQMQGEKEKIIAHWQSIKEQPRKPSIEIRKSTSAL